jgi:osmotically-inducible protein OsmY
VDASEIGVLVNGRVVTLTGHVRSYAEKLAAEKAVKRLTSVQAIANDLEIRLPNDRVRDDEAIAGAALSALAWRSDIPADRIKVMVDNGWLRLEGQVEWDYQRKAAEKTVRKLTGLRGVFNNLSVKPHVLVSDVRGKIEDALKRTAALESSRIDVAVDGSTVMLRGAVHTWAEWNAAENAAWAAPGVTKVKNHLTVEPLVFA